MKIRSSVRSFGTLVTLFAALGARAAWASPCTQDARGEFKDCKAGCVEDYQVAKDACLDRDHQCVELCRAKREDCREATGIDQAFAACEATLESAKQNCRDQHPAGSDDRDRCIDQAQVVAFQCRDTAREQFGPALKQCRRDFRVCARGCGPPEQPDPIGVAQCKDTAKQNFRICNANCREDFQVAVDACLNRDHACVEQCRADRESCRQPIEDRLDSDIAACNARRDSDIQNCKNIFADGSPEQEQCIDDAQVAAFECRDQARENARPDFEICRGRFRDCVQACPPAS
ncbi:MAG: hypothetical protein E6J75_03450 [Deltaproteobacteria bacterium]|nr:MAG: hypothetical protein E6J75_03450 [Deltaproteobacteria bacterium]